MLRSIPQAAGLVVVLTLALAWFVPAVRAQENNRAGEPPEQQRVDGKWEDRLNQLRLFMSMEVTFGPLDDPKLTLGDILEHLAERFEITFQVNEAAFAAEKVKNVKSAKVVKRQLNKLSRVSFDTVLRQVLARVPSKSGATYVLRCDRIEITTTAALRAEVWGPDHKGPFLPVVSRSYDKLLLDLCFKDLANATGFNIVVDARVGEKLKTAATASFHNVPLDTAVRVLADMADLKAVQLDNMLYVTTRENAKSLQEEQEKRKAKMAEAAPATNGK
jgi:hypothetical protein